MINIETIVRQRELKDPVTLFLAGEVIDLLDVNEINDQLRADNNLRVLLDY